MMNIADMGTSLAYVELADIINWTLSKNRIHDGFSKYGWL